MRAATIRDGEIAVREHPDPVPEAGELLVRVRTAGLNGADMLQLKGGYPAPAGSPPDIPGLELAGEVVASGRDVRRFEPGDRVMAIVGGGGQAELAIVHERVAMPVPDELDWTAAGAHIAALGVNALEPDGFDEHGPFDVVLELVGAPNLPGNLAALAECGRICVIGVGAGAKVELNLLALMGKRARIHGSVLRARSLDAVADAYARFAAGSKLGKIVLQL